MFTLQFGAGGSSSGARFGGTGQSCRYFGESQTQLVRWCFGCRSERSAVAQGQRHHPRTFPFSPPFFPLSRLKNISILVLQEDVLEEVKSYDSARRPDYTSWYPELSGRSSLYWWPSASTAGEVFSVSCPFFKKNNFSGL